MTTHRMGEGSSADTSALPKADDGPVLLEGSSRVVRRVMAVPILLAAVLYVAGRLWPQRVASGVLAVPVLYAFAVAAGGVVTYLLYAKACVLEQDRFRWLSAGFGVASLALLAEASTLSGSSPVRWWK